MNEPKTTTTTNSTNGTRLVVVENCANVKLFEVIYNKSNRTSFFWNIF